MTFSDILCKLGIHKWIQSSDFDSENTIKAEVCENCYKKRFIRNKRNLIRKASKSDIREIKITKIIKEKPDN